MGKFLFIVEHVAFPKRASFLQIPIKMGNYPYNWENSYKNGKILISNGKFIFLAYPIPHNMPKILSWKDYHFKNSLRILMNTMSTMSDDISWKFSIKMIFSIKNGMGKHLHSSFSDTRAPKVYLFLSVF